MRVVKFIVALTLVLLMLTIGLIFAYGGFSGIEDYHVIFNDIFTGKIDKIFYIYALAALFIPIAVLRSDALKTSGEYGNAHFATNREMAKMKLFEDTGMIVGIKGSKFIRINDPRSMAVFAPPGTGKTVSIMVPNLLSIRSSIVAIDIKGELFEMTSEYRKTFSKVQRFSPSERNSSKWNPFAESALPDDWNEKIKVVEQVSFALKPDTDKEDQNHWSIESRAMFVFFALYLIWKDGGTTIPKVREFSYTFTDVQEFIAEIIDLDDLPQRIREEATRLLSKDAREFGSVQSTFNAFMQPFADAVVSENLSENEINLKDFRANSRTLYVVIPLNEMERVAPVVRAFFNVELRKLQSELPTKEDLMIYLLLDEFTKLGRMTEIFKAPEIGRSYKVPSVFMAQDYGQIEEVYGQAGVKQLQTNTAYKIILTQNSEETAEKVSKDIAHFTRVKKSKSSSAKDGSMFGKNRSDSESTEQRRLVTAQEIMNMGETEGLLLVQGNYETPVKLKLARWFEVPTLKQIVKKYRLEKNR